MSDQEDQEDLGEMLEELGQSQPAGERRTYRGYSN